MLNNNKSALRVFDIHGDFQLAYDDSHLSIKLS
jgi:hypothetical protein